MWSSAHWTSRALTETQMKWLQESHKPQTVFLDEGRIFNPIEAEKKKNVPDGSVLLSLMTCVSVSGLVCVWALTDFRVDVHPALQDVTLCKMSLKYPHWWIFSRSSTGPTDRHPCGSSARVMHRSGRRDTRHQAYVWSTLRQGTYRFTYIFLTSSPYPPPGTGAVCLQYIQVDWCGDDIFVTLFKE